MRLMFEPLRKIPCTLMLTVVHVNLTIFFGGGGGNDQEVEAQRPELSLPQCKKILHADLHIWRRLHRPTVSDYFWTVRQRFSRPSIFIAGRA